MSWKIKSKNSSNVVVSEMLRLSNNDLSKIKKHFKDESNEDKYKKILNSLELLVKGQKITQKDFKKNKVFTISTWFYCGLNSNIFNIILLEIIFDNNKFEPYTYPKW